MKLGSLNNYSFIKYLYEELKNISDIENQSLLVVMRESVIEYLLFKDIIGQFTRININLSRCGCVHKDIKFGFHSFDCLPYCLTFHTQKTTLVIQIERYEVVHDPPTIGQYPFSSLLSTPLYLWCPSSLHHNYDLSPTNSIQLNSSKCILQNQSKHEIMLI